MPMNIHERHAGEGPVPPTLAADISASPSASRRGEPAPAVTPQERDR